MGKIKISDIEARKSREDVMLLLGGNATYKQKIGYSDSDWRGLYNIKSAVQYYTYEHKLASNSSVEKWDVRKHIPAYRPNIRRRSFRTIGSAIRHNESISLNEFLNCSLIDFSDLSITPPKPIKNSDQAEFAFDHFIEIIQKSQHHPKLEIDFNGNIIGTISAELESIHSSIERSAERLYDDFENDIHNPENALSLQATWIKAIELLVKVAEGLLDKKIILATPRIFKGYANSIELEWDTDEFECSINVSEKNGFIEFEFIKKDNSDQRRGFRDSKNIEYTYETIISLFANE